MLIRRWWEFLHFIHMLERNIFVIPRSTKNIATQSSIFLRSFQSGTNSKASIVFLVSLHQWSLIFPANKTILKGNSFLLWNLSFQELHATSGKQAAMGTKGLSCLGDIHISWLLRCEKRNILESGYIVNEVLSRSGDSVQHRFIFERSWIALYEIAWTVSGHFCLVNT